MYDGTAERRASDCDGLSSPRANLINHSPHSRSLVATLCQPCRSTGQRTFKQIGPSCVILGMKYSWRKAAVSKTRLPQPGGRSNLRYDVVRRARPALRLWLTSLVWTGTSDDIFRERPQSWLLSVSQMYVTASYRQIWSCERVNFM